MKNNVENLSEKKTERVLAESALILGLITVMLMFSFYLFTTCDLFLIGSHLVGERKELAESLRKWSTYYTWAGTFTLLGFVFGVFALLTGEEETTVLTRKVLKRTILLIVAICWGVLAIGGLVFVRFAMPLPK